MTCRVGETVPASGIYWCTVCKLPVRFTEGEQFPECKNMCSRGHWELVEGKKTGQQPESPKS